MGNILTQRILLTGGGSAGHVSVHLALIPKLLEDDWHIDYIGSYEGIERQLIADIDKVTYYPIASGKLRRYFSWQNFIDPFKVLKGIWQAYRLMGRLKPAVVFSKGGFVSVPVVIAAKMRGIPVISHESDMTPGLANRIALPFVSTVCTTFPETVQQLNSNKATYIGPVIRESLTSGYAETGRSFCGFNQQKPVLLIMGGSLGAKKINEAVWEHLDTLLTDFQIVHICGEGNVREDLSTDGYRQFAYINEELPDVLAMTDMVISRAGANSIFEFLTLQIPMLLIPLSGSQSRGDQILNAHSFETSGYANVLKQEDLTADALFNHIQQLYAQKQDYIERMKAKTNSNPSADLIQYIQQTAKY